MKNLLVRLAALTMALALVFSFAACGAKNDGAVTTTAADSDENKLPAGISIQETKGSFSDPADENKVVYTYNLFVPQVDAKNFPQADLINQCIKDVADQKINHAKNNVENAAAWFAAHEDAVPWAIESESELTFSNSKYLCFRIDFSYGYGSQARTGNSQALCISTETGLVCPMESFLAPNASRDEVAARACADIITKSVNEYGVSTLKQDMKNPSDVLPNFSYENFYFTNNGVTFYFNPGTIDDVDDGRVEISYTASEISDLLLLPVAG